MLHRLRNRLTYANVMSTLAVFIALGGSSYAAFTINGNTIKNRSIAGKKLRHNTLTGAQIKESRLARVPRAKRADTLGGLTAAELKIKCPADTFPIADVCVGEDAARGRVVRERGAHLPGRGDTCRSRAAASDARRAPRGAGGGAARARRRADVQRLPVELEPGRARRALRHRPGRKRRR